MAWGDITAFLSTVGLKVSEVSSSLFSFLSSKRPAQIATILFFFILAYLVIVVVQKPIKWVIVILAVILAISVGVSIAT